MQKPKPQQPSADEEKSLHDDCHHVMHCHGVRVTVIIEGENMAQVTGTYRITIQPATPTPLQIVPPDADLGAGQVGVALQEDVATISGGTAPYTFTVSSGAVPSGVTLGSVDNPDGSVTLDLSGTPDTAGAFSFAVTVTDAAGATASTAVRRKVIK